MPAIRGSYTHIYTMTEQTLEANGVQYVAQGHFDWRLKEQGVGPPTFAEPANSFRLYYELGEYLVLIGCRVSVKN